MSDVRVTNNRDKHRYEARIGESVAGVAEYQITDDLVVFTHTEVDPAFEGQGVGGSLARFALDEIRAEGTHQVMPLCPFIAAWIRKHPDYVSMVFNASER